MTPSESRERGKMTAESILKSKLPGDLFSSPDALEDEFRALAKRWHPDKPGGNQAVMDHIMGLREEGKRQISFTSRVAQQERTCAVAKAGKRCEEDLGDC